MPTHADCTSVTVTDTVNPFRGTAPHANCLRSPDLPLSLVRRVVASFAPVAQARSARQGSGG
ncbi:MAG: hypothetical protein JO250_12205 [Armatimonadetes bacterium]|nr:hypothetical protein [Armatimonadota bacterium]